MEVYCHQGDSNGCTQYTTFKIKRKVTLNYPKSAAKGFFPRDSSTSFETAVVNKPSMFEPLSSTVSLMSYNKRNEISFQYPKGSPVITGLVLLYLMVLLR